MVPGKWGIVVMNLTLLFLGGGLWHIWELFVRKATECSELNELLLRLEDIWIEMQVKSLACDFSEDLVSRLRLESLKDSIPVTF